MAKVLVERWGAELAELRESSGLSAASVVQRLGELGIQFDRTSIYLYEAGKVAAPDAGVVWGLAQVYGVPVAELIADLVAVRQGHPRGHRAQTGAPAEPPHPKLSDDERELVRDWRLLSPQARKACREFIRFQLSSSSLPPPTARRSTKRAKASA